MRLHLANMAACLTNATFLLYARWSWNTFAVKGVPFILLLNIFGVVVWIETIHINIKRMLHIDFKKSSQGTHSTEYISVWFYMCFFFIRFHLNFCRMIYIWYCNSWCCTAFGCTINPEIGDESLSGWHLIFNFSCCLIKVEWAAAIFCFFFFSCSH